MKTWYTIKAKANDSAEISIYDEIGVWGVTAAAFIADLKKLGDVKDILLTVNSPGGSVFDGLAMYNALSAARNKGTKITARVMGIAASAASFVIMAANEIEMPENSMMMVHYASGLAWGNADTMRETADILDKIDASIVGVYVARTGKDEKDVRALLEAETYLTAQEAKDAGFADTVTENVKATANFEIDRLPESVQALFKAAQTPPAPEPKQTPAPIADQVRALCEASGMSDFADDFALSVENVEQAQARIDAAREITALCAVAKKPDSAAGFIRENKSLADVRAALVNERADNKEIDTARRTNPPSASNETQPEVKVADIWAKRRKQLSV